MGLVALAWGCTVTPPGGELGGATEQPPPPGTTGCVGSDCTADTSGGGPGCAPTDAACPVCGNGACDPGETCSDCPADCGPCDGLGCGNAQCEAQESCEDCPADCGECPPDTCGDGTCEDTDHCSLCPQDCGACEGEAEAATRGPYLQNGSAEAVTVRWRTDEPTDSVVVYGLEANALQWAATDSEPTTEHEVRLTGLSPRTVYYYAFGETGASLNGQDTDHTFITALSPGQPGPVRIWAIGDSGDVGQEQDDVYQAYRDLTGDQRTDVWLMLGDNAYSDGTDDEYQEAVFEAYPALLRDTMLWSTVGNHERVDEGGAYFSIFTLPTEAEAGGLASGTESYYSFDYGNVHFVCLDSDQHDESEEMATWLTNDLESYSGTWIIAFWHHPPYTKGSHDSDNEGTLAAMREGFVPILEDHGVDLVLTGHSHSYERSYLLNGHYGESDTLDSAHLVDEGDGREEGDGAYDKGTAPEGAVYIVAGSSSKTSSMDGIHPAMHVSLEELGSMVIDVDGTRLDARFLDDQGEVRDSFTMLKEAL
ncbi:MAG: metallophosphoesterase [Deltaproteobacteria bacterium]|nr:metallophosphoesterase [Deltaproteobacteria bacterium]